MYHLYGEKDYELYKRFLTETKDNGDIMCKKLKQFNKKSAYDLLDESGQLAEIPVNLDKILEHYGVAKIPSQFTELEALEINRGKGEISGLVLSAGDELGVFYKKTDNIHRKRFTIAHELAHCCLHTDSLKEGYVELRKPDYSDEKERAADIFAGELLIPEHQLDYALQRLIKPSLYGLADLFQVSTNVMRARMEFLKKPYFDDKIGKMITVE